MKNANSMPSIHIKIMDILDCLKEYDGFLPEGNHAAVLRKTEWLIRQCLPAGHKAHEIVELKARSHNTTNAIGMDQETFGLLLDLYCKLADVKNHRMDTDDYLDTLDIAEKLAWRANRESTMTTGGIREHIRQNDLRDIDPEDLAIFQENERQRGLWTPEGMRNLLAAVCDQAVQDYKTARNASLRCNMQEELEEFKQFFGSEMFLGSSGLRSREQAVTAIDEAWIRERRKKMMDKMA